MAITNDAAAAPTATFEIIYGSSDERRRRVGYRAAIMSRLEPSDRFEFARLPACVLSNCCTGQQSVLGLFDDASELDTVRNAHLPEAVSKVSFDRLLAQEQQGSYFSGRTAIDNEPRDLEFALGQRRHA